MGFLRYEAAGVATGGITGSAMNASANISTSHISTTYREVKTKYWMGPDGRTGWFSSRKEAGGGPIDPGSSSSSSTEISRRRRERTPRPRRYRRCSSSSSPIARSWSQIPPAHSNVPEYPNNLQSRTFEPLTPGGRIYNGEPDMAHRRGRSRSTSPLFRALMALMRNKVPMAHPPMVPVRAPASISSRGDQNARLCADHGDKVTNTLRSSFIDDATAAGWRSWSHHRRP